MYKHCIQQTKKHTHKNINLVKYYVYRVCMVRDIFKTVLSQLKIQTTKFKKGGNHSQTKTNQQTTNKTKKHVKLNT